MGEDPLRIWFAKYHHETNASLGCRHRYTTRQPEAATAGGSRERGRWVARSRGEGIFSMPARSPAGVGTSRVAGGGGRVAAAGRDGEGERFQPGGSALRVGGEDDVVAARLEVRSLTGMMCSSLSGFSQ
jgi:hypothetical protein